MSEKYISRAAKLLIFISAALLFSVFFLPFSAEASENEYRLFLKTTSDGNLFLDKYDAEIYWDNEKIATLEQDGTTENLLSSAGGEHTLYVYSADDHDIVSSKKITITSDTTVSCTIKTHSDTIDLRDVSVVGNADAAKVELQSLSNSLLSDAIDGLNKSGFDNIRYAADDGSKIKKKSNWMVISQEPAAGEKIFPDTAVSVTCIKPDTFVKENITGNSVADAVKNAETSGLGRAKELGYTPCSKCA